ncbi:MAG TPA: DinB family protein [Streptosporangiaceae bacterium]|nr:DinB family protein [Streptosporangiaceae bacterium]
MDRETETLLASLDQQRSHVTGILEGFTEEQLRRPVLPSGWSCLGMVKHLALADEHYWFRCIMAGESLDFFPAERNSEWRLAPGETAEDVFGLYRDEIARSNEVIARTPIDAPPGQRDPWWGSWADRFTELRVVMLHVIAETACHAGHLDAAAELIDGRQWIVQ